MDKLTAPGERQDWGSARRLAFLDPSLPLALKLARLFGQPVEAIFFLEEAGPVSPAEATAAR